MNRIPFRPIVLAALPFLLTSFSAAGAPTTVPEIASRSAILIDATTGETLYEKASDLQIPPASLTKLVTIDVALQDVKTGRIGLKDVVPISRAAWGASQPWGSSLMFLAPGQIVTLRELLLGLAVDSGNDAAVATAEYVGGSVRAFVERMNAYVLSLGLAKTRFVDTSGYSELNMTTAREFAAFCRAYVRSHPEALAEFHSVTEFAYPKAENVPEAYREDPRTIVQQNRNLLLGELEGVDGLKTGYIMESGYNIALTGSRNGTRLIAVLLGGPGKSSTRGGRIRADDGSKLLSWGFENFRTISPEIGALESVRIWKGARKFAVPVPGGAIEFTAAIDRGHDLTYAVVYYKDVQAPLAKGAPMGELVFSDGEGPLKRVGLVASDAVTLGGPLRRFADTVQLFFLRLFGKI